jgi:hypothetical protein
LVAGIAAGPVSVSFGPMRWLMQNSRRTAMLTIFWGAALFAACNRPPDSHTTESPNQPQAEPVLQPGDELILGRWQGETTLTIKSDREGVKDEVFTSKVWAEYRKDGTVTFTEDGIPELKDRLPDAAKGIKVTGKYSFVKDTEIEVTLEADGRKVTYRAKVAVTKDQLSVAQIVQGKAQSPEKFKRAKD